MQGGESLLDLAFPLTKNVLLKLATKATLIILDKVERKITGQGAVRVGRGFTLLISNGHWITLLKQ